MLTIKDVAREAHLSPTTVSRVLNNRGYISEKTRKLVYDTMERLNYHPNQIARSLQSNTSNLIAILVPDFQRTRHLRGTPVHETQLSLDFVQFLRYLRKRVAIP